MASRLKSGFSLIKVYCKCKWQREIGGLQVFDFNNYNDSRRWSSDFNRTRSSNSRNFFVKYASGAAIFLGGATLLYNIPVTQAKDVGTKATEKIPHLPTYTATQVAEHDSKEKKIWVSFKNGVYDLTGFVDQHPGGDKILLGAGGALEPFWLLYAAHDTPQVYSMLEKYRIGNLSDEDVGDAVKNMSDPYANDPKRHPALKPASVKPFNAEPPLQLLVDSFYTPNDLFFVRHHLPVPHVDEESYELEVTGQSVKTINLSLSDLKTKFPKCELDVTIQCAGNRRSEMIKIKPVKGLNWGAAAISNAKWGGVKLRDVLLAAGIKENDPKIKHIQFEGLDCDVTGTCYGASITFERAMDPRSDCLLAFEMNGEPIPLDHGYPVRAIVPGVVGARNVKWLSRIVISEEESPSHWQQNDYKGFSPQVDWDTVDFKSAPAIAELPIQSAICDPVDGSSIPVINGRITVRGYAWSGGGRKVVRVDVSADGGKTWHVAKLEPTETPLHRTWSWALWKAEIPLPPNLSKSKTKLELMCKAVDAAYNCQPDTVAPIWNLRGVLSNAWHRINCSVKDRSDETRVILKND